MFRGDSASKFGDMRELWEIPEYFNMDYADD